VAALAAGLDERGPARATEVPDEFLRPGWLAEDAVGLAHHHQRAVAAQQAGKFADEIVAVEVPGRKGAVTVVDADECPREDTTADGLAALRPAFKKDGGTVTAGNASGINDGAAAIVLMSKEEADRRGIAPLARIVSWATAGVDPAIMGSGPIPASRAALEKAG